MAARNRRIQSSTDAGSERLGCRHHWPATTSRHTTPVSPGIEVIRSVMILCTHNRQSAHATGEHRDHCRYFPARRSAQRQHSHDLLRHKCDHHGAGEAERGGDRHRSVPMREQRQKRNPQNRSGDPSVTAAITLVRRRAHSDTQTIVAASAPTAEQPRAPQVG